MKFLSMPEAAKALNLDGPRAGRRALTLLKVKQRGCKQRVLWSRGLGAKRPQWMTTDVALRRACPEFFDNTDEIASHLRSFFRDIKREVAGLRLEVEEIREAQGLLTQAYQRRFGT